MKLFLYILIIGFTLATYRAFFKLIKIEPSYAMVLVGIVMSFMALCIHFYLHGLQFQSLNKSSSIGILLGGISLFICSYFIIHGLQLGFKISTFSPSYAILSSLFIFIIGVYFYGDAINGKNVFGLFLGVLAIYFLSIK